MQQLNGSAEIDDLKSNARLFEYSFKKSTDVKNENVSFGLPFFEFAVAQPADLAKALGAVTDDRPSNTESYLVAVAENGDLRISDLEKWIKTESKFVELNLRYARVIWSSKKCVIVTSAQSEPGALASVIYFTFFELKLASLLKKITEFSRTVQNDCALTHQVSKSDLVHSTRVNEMTRWTWSARMQYAGIESGLHLLSDELDADGKRLVGELANSVNMTDRLEVLNDQLEIMEDLYELANDRLSEYTFYFNEYKLEVWIIILLVVESAIMLLEALSVMHHG